VSGAVNSVIVDYEDMYFNWANGSVNLLSWLEKNSDKAQVLKDIKKQYNIGAIPTGSKL